jgi:predicted flap endonuclease-1-like 5' DNA nuclease
MIWHFLEVWAVLLISFAVGCVLGAYVYGLLAESRLALAQGAVADHVGDAVDRIKVTLGIGPDWRPQMARSVERPAPRVEPEPVRVEVEIIEEAEFEEISVLEEVAEQLTEADTPAAPPRLQAPPPERPRLQGPPVEAPSAEDDFAADESVEPDRLASTGAVEDDGVVPMRPAGLARPRGGVPDNLTRIRGIGERNETRLNSLGIFHFGQIAAWTPGEVRWIGQYLAFPERIERDDWVGQAMILASGGDTGFEKSAERRRRRRREQQRGADAAQLAADVEAVMGRRRSQPKQPDDREDD